MLFVVYFYIIKRRLSKRLQYKLKMCF